MTRMVFGTVMGLAAMAIVATGTGFAREQTSTKKDQTEACMQMMQGAGGTQEGAMANMMEMARRMGNGDVMLGMTKMMEMMGSMGGGGMVGGQGGMMSPGSGQPTK